MYAQVIEEPSSCGFEEHPDRKLLLYVLDELVVASVLLRQIFTFLLRLLLLLLLELLLKMLMLDILLFINRDSSFSSSEAFRRGGFVRTLSQ